MPTGYTQPIADGITFEQFALNCARAFGACITLRDEQGGGEKIPDSFEPSDYHEKALIKARADLAAIQALSPEECESSADHDFKADQASRDDQKARMVDLRQKYEDMLVKVEAWNPPSTDHVGMKEFMYKQITESINWDCSYTHYDEPAVRLTGTEWREQKMKTILGSIEYHKESHAKEIERTNQRNEWVRLLRTSLVPQS